MGSAGKKIRCGDSGDWETMNDDVDAFPSCSGRSKTFQKYICNNTFKTPTCPEVSSVQKFKNVFSANNTTSNHNY